jgi:hypothetical protein
MRPRSPSSLLLLLSLLLNNACLTGWYRPAPPLPATFGPRERVQLWREGRPLVLHAVRIDSTTVSGVPALRPPDCDSCRVVLPRDSVDSLRVGGSDDTTIAVAGLAGFVVIVGLLFQGLMHESD